MTHLVLLTIHITSGSVAILSGFLSLFSKKGASVHLKSGYIFYISMLLMGSTATYLAFFEPFPTNRIVGLLTIYLVFTARRAALNRKGATDKFDVLSMGYAFFVTILGVYYSIQTINQLGAEGLGVLEYFLFFYTGIAALGAILDLSVLIRGSIVGARRVARHMWRMTFAHWIAVGSLFMGQQDVFPSFLRQQPMVLAAPFIMVSLALLFWIGRVWFVKRFKLQRVKANSN